jgi:hypothetical protein
MPLSAEATQRFLATWQRGPGEYVETSEHEPTLEALRWAAEIFWLLSGQLFGPAAFVGQCQRPGGAFAMTAADPVPSRAASYYAVRVLTLSGQRDDIPRELRRWLTGEMATPGQPATSDIDEMFYVLRALQQLEALSLLTPEVSKCLVDFIQRSRDADGGYGGMPGQSSDTEHTYCAICALSLLGQPLTDAEGRVTAAWLRSRFDTPSGLVALRATDDTPSLAATYWGFRAAELLSATVCTDRLGAAVGSLAKPDGGYGTQTHATLWESYCALQVLHKLSALRGGAQ